MDLWAYRHGVRIDFSRPKTDRQCLRRIVQWELRAEGFDVQWFTTLAEAKQLIERWRREYDQNRPHSALGERTPGEFASQLAA